MTRRIPATVITGFLGAGKTTLIRSLIANAGGRRLALIINEFGDVGIDGELLRACGVPGCSDDDIIELANGCICCTVADDFLPTLETLLARDPRPDHIVIETSGLALPQPLLRAFAWPEVRTQVTVDGVVTVIDAHAVAAGRFADDEEAIARQRDADDSLDHDNPIAELFEDQLSCADLVVLSKTDLVTDADLVRVEATVAAGKRAAARVVRAAHGQLPVAVLLGVAAQAEADAANRRSHHDDEHHTAEDHDEFLSISVPIGEVASAQQLTDLVRAVLADDDVLRVKGFAAVAGTPGRLVVQAVGPRIETYFDRPWGSGEARDGHLVVIGLDHMNLDQVRRRLGAIAADGRCEAAQ